MNITAQAPTQIYVGLRAAVMAEVGTPSYYEGKYLLQPYSEAEWDAEGAPSMRVLLEMINYYKESYPGIEVIWL